MEEISEYDEDGVWNREEHENTVQEKPKRRKKRKHKHKEKRTDDRVLFKINTVSSETTDQPRAEIKRRSDRNADEAGVNVETKHDPSHLGQSPSHSGQTGSHSGQSPSHSGQSLSLSGQPARRRITHKTLSEGFYCEKDTDDIILDYGEIKFSGYENHVGGSSPYIRVTTKTDPAVIWEVLIEEWKLSLPDLVISISGGLKMFQMVPRLKERFKRGLIETATTTGAWIITGGCNGGIMEFVGEAVRDHLITSRGRRRIVTIGMPIVGFIKNKKSFRIKPTKLRDAFEDLGCTKHVAEYDAGEVKYATDGSYELDHNHTHFIMVDSEQNIGDKDDFECQVQLRSSFERMINNHVYFGNQSSVSNCNKIPVIHIVIGGGFHTACGIVELLKSGISVIVLAGSGRTADLIATSLSHLGKTGFDKSEVADMVYDQKAELKIPEDSFDAYIDCMTDILSYRYRRLLNVYKINDAESTDFQSALLEALLKAKEANTTAKLALALAWNRCDIVENKILHTRNLEHFKGDIDDLMVKALVQDKHEFVGYFLEHGINPCRYADNVNLWNLYANSLQCRHTDKTTDMLLKILSPIKRSFFTFLTCKPVKDFQTDHEDLVIYIGKAIEKLLRDSSLNPHRDVEYWRARNQICNMGYITSTNDTIRKGNTETALQNLFFWSILMNRREMAFQFWKMLPRHHIAAALVASSLFRQMSKYAERIEDLDLSETISENTSFYENLAFGVLTECYNNDKDLARKILIQKTESFGNTTILFLAENNYRVDFMSHSCCQSLLRLLWKGKIAFHVSTIQIILTMLLPVFLPFIKFVTAERKWGEREDDGFTIFEEPKMKSYNVSICGSSNKQSISFPRAIYYFYSAPITIYWANIISYLIFLGIFSIFLLARFDINNVSVYEYITYAFVFSSMLEQFRQITAAKKDHLMYKLKTWCHEEWNTFSLINDVAIIISIILRFSLPQEYFFYARIAFSLTLILHIMRFLESLFISEDLGPKVIMIRRMLRDLLSFFLLLIVFMFSFGIAYEANLYPNSPIDVNLLKSIVYHPYFQIYGELFIENMEGSEPSVCSSNETEWKSGILPRCPEKSVFVIILLGIYMLVSNILLVNLVIAMFAHTFNKVQENSRKIWRFHRCRMVYKYCDSPVLVPPFIVISHVIRLVWSLVFKFYNRCARRNAFRKRFKPEEFNAICLFEKESVETYLHHISKSNSSKETSKTTRVNQVEESVYDTKHRLEKLQNDYETNSQDIREMKVLMEKQSRDIRSLQATISALTEAIERKGVST